MTIFVLFGQRKEDYDGQFAPEALAVISCYGQEENPDYMADELAKYEATKEFIGLRVCEVSIGSQSSLRDILVGTPSIKGQVIKDGTQG
jgi:hypothetical protein